MAEANFEEIGTAGLRSYSGVVREEYDYKLSGPQGRRIYQQMSDDPVIGAMLFAVDRILRQVQWKVEGDDPDAVTFIDECRNDMSQTWADTVSEILSMNIYGWSYFETVYKRRLGNTDDGATRSRHKDGRIGWRKWALRSQDSLSRWDVDNNGGVQAMVQRSSSGREVPIPIQKSLHFRTSAFKNNPEGKSLLRTAYRAWYFRTNIEGIGVERDLAGLPVVKIPVDWFKKDAPQHLQDLREQLTQLVKNVRRNEQEGAVLPEIYDPETKQSLVKFELLASSSRRQFDTNTIIQRKNVEMLMSMLADFLLLGHQQIGSYGLGGTKTQLFARALNSLVQTICEVVNRFAIIRLLELNGMDTDNPPRLTAEPLDEVSLEELTNLIKDGGVQMNLETENVLRDRAGLPQRTEDDGDDDDDQGNARTDKREDEGADSERGTAAGAAGTQGGATE